MHEYHLNLATTDVSDLISIGNETVLWIKHKLKTLILEPSVAVPEFSFSVTKYQSDITYAGCEYLGWTEVQ